MLQPLGSRDSWPCGQGHSAIPPLLRWVLEIKGEALCCCNAIDVNWEAGTLLLITVGIKLESSRLKLLPLACAGSIDHSNLTYTLKAVL